MCWNPEVSFVTFAIGIFAIALGYINKFPTPYLLFLFSFIVMQFLEFLAWLNLRNKKWNKIIAVFIGIVLALQPLTAIYLLRDSHPELMKMFMTVYLILLLIVQIIYGLRLNTNYTFIGSNGHLVWNQISKNNITFLGLLLYMFFFFAPMIILIREYTILFVVSLTTLLWSFYYFYKYDTWGTMWCWTGNLLSLLIILQILLSTRLL